MAEVCYSLYINSSINIKHYLFNQFLLNSEVLNLKGSSFFLKRILYVSIPAYKDQSTYNTLFTNERNREKNAKESILCLQVKADMLQLNDLKGKQRNHDTFFQ